MTKSGYHKHKSVIEAWANGAKIEFKSLDGTWHELASGTDWNPDDEFRVKPELKIAGMSQAEWIRYVGIQEEQNNFFELIAAAFKETK